MTTAGAQRAGSRPPLGRALAMLLSLTLLAAACSSDDSGNGDSQGESGGGEQEGSTEVDLSVLGEPNPASGDPVLIGFGAGLGAEGQAEGAEQLLEGAEIAVAYQNEYLQGLAGQPVELVTCDMGALPETAIDCANQFVDEGVVAVVAPVTSSGGSAVPIVTGAGIPYVSFAATSFEELSTEGAFSIAGGGAAGLGVVAMDAAEKGYEKVSHVVIDVPQITVVATTVGDPLFEAAGLEQQTILAPLGVPDLTSQLSTATGDAILISGDEAVCASALQAYRTLGLTTPLYVQQTCIDEDIEQSVPGIYDGMLLTTSLTNSGGDSELYAAMIENYSPDEDIPGKPIESGQVAVGASTIVSLMTALEGITEPTAAAITAGLESSGAHDLFLAEPSTFDCGEPILALASSLCSVQGHLAVLDADGNVTESQFYDPTELFATALAG